MVADAIKIAHTHDAAVGAFIDRYDEAALAQAVDADAALAGGVDNGPLHGIPIGVKDIISTSDGPTTAQSLVLDPEWGLAHGDAVVTSRLRAAGAIILGKLTTCEFALGTPDFDRPFPIPRNPWGLDYWAGGSSSGSGSAVAMGMVLGALGTDTAGSIRLPAAYCGVTGLMPTFGRVPKSGCVPLGFSLDHIGPLTRTARDAAIMLSVLAGPDASDPNSAQEPVPDYLAALDGDLSGLRVGVQRLDEYSSRVDPALPSLFGDVVDALAAAGAHVAVVDLPLYQEVSAACWLTFLCEASAYHMPDLRSKWSDFAPSTRRRLGAAFAVSGADYVQAQRARRVAQKAVAALFEDVDLVLTPTSSWVAYKISELVQSVEGAYMDEVHTSYWDAIGNPVISIPMGFGVDSMPLAVQIAGRPFEEDLVLKAADAFQRQTIWHLERPAVYDRSI